MEQLNIVKYSVPIVHSEKTEDSIRSLIHMIFPTWDDKNCINVKLISGGFLNNVYQLDKAEDTVMIRVFNDITHDVIDDVTSVIIGMAAVYKAGYGAKVHAVFDNGVVYGYLRGEMTLPEKYDNPIIRRKMLIKAVQLSTLCVDDIEINGRRMSTEARCFTDLKIAINNCPPDLDGTKAYGSEVPYLRTKAILSQEVEWGISEVNKLNLPLCFSHGDFWWGNILYDAKTDDLHIIDYDFCGYNPYPLDLCRLMVNARFFMADVPHWEQLSEDEDRSLCYLFIKETRALNNNSSPVTDKDVNTLFAITRTFKMFAILHIMTVCVTISQNPRFNLMPELERAYRILKQDYLSHKSLKPEDFVVGWKPW